MGEAERERRHCIFFYKLPEDEKPRKSNAIYAVETPPKAPLPDNDLELSSPPQPNSRPYVQSIYVTGDNDDNFSTKFETKSSNYHLEFEEGNQPNLGVHGSVACLQKQELSVPVKAHEPENTTHRFFSHKYAPFILKNGVRMIVSISYVIYLVIAIFGCLNFREGLEPKNLVTSTHYIAQYFDDIKLFWKIGPQLHVNI